MSSTMLAPPQAGQGRMSQLLPSVKCSTCHQPVPLAELGEHVCSGPPQVPTLPKPSVSPERVNNLLPARLQGLVAQPGGPPSPAQSNPPRSPPTQHQRGGSAASERLRVSTNTAGQSGAGFQPRSSPLARSDVGQGGSSPTSMSDSYRARPLPADPRMRNNSLSSNYSAPPPPRSTGSPMNGPPPPIEQNRFPPSRNGSPQIPNSTPAGLPSTPRAPPNGPSTGRPSFSAMPPISRNASPAPSQLSRNQPSPAPSMTRPGAPQQMRGPPSQRPPTVPPPPPPQGLPGGPPGRNGIPFPGGPPPQSGMQPGPPRPPFGGHGPQRSYAPSLPSGPSAGHIMAPPLVTYGQPVPEDGIDTRSGGEAGMAGVGRKGFAAVARAAMFATAGPHMRPLGPPIQNSRPDMPRYLDIDAASRSTDTPPLSAGSGYSSHSPGPTSPLSQFPPEQQPAEKMPGRLPTPPRIDTSVVNPSIPEKSKTPVDKEKTPVGTANTPASPFGIRLPFFEKLKGLVPGSNSPIETTSTSSTPTAPQAPSGLSLQKDINDVDRSTPTPTPPAPRSTPPSSESSVHLHYRSDSTSQSSSSRYDRDNDRAPISPTSGSEYSGLAYEASTDAGDEVRSQGSMRSDRSSRRRELPPLPPMPPNAAAKAASASTLVTSSSASGRVHFSADRSAPIPIGRKPSNTSNGAHSRNTSSSSYSSASSVDSLGGPRPPKTNSSTIAHALGLSRTPPSDYSKLGGPGVPSRLSRIGRSTSNSSIGSRSPYSRVVPASAGPSAFDMLERTMGSMIKKGEEEDKERIRADEEKKAAKAVASELVKSKSSGMIGSVRQRTAGGSSFSGSARGTDYAASDYERGSVAGSSGSRAHRSNTVQGLPSSPDALKAAKLPMRARTTTTPETSASGEIGARAKERRMKEKACVKCRKLIDDGRWIQVDTGSILCERCWKNMYLPKCRRCNLPIEKQAVSSSDGQLKGKYHKECFNCHTCHKPFPDKTFYVFDGKPFCAYHYHEANESLCAAARCGQPIEGPCAVSHAGDRYHPNCMTCEYPGYPACREGLKEYFEVDGRMLCERHAMSGGSDEEDEQWTRSTKATRRITRFIDLAGGGPGLGNNNGSPGGGGAGGGANDDGLR